MTSTNNQVTVPTDPRQRMLRGDEPLLIQLLKDQGFEVHTRNGNRIDAYQKGTKEVVCGLTWHKGTATVPGRWTFDISLGDANSWWDVKMLLQELKRVHPMRRTLRDAWAEYLESKSDKRWSHYLSHLALLFLPRSPASKGDTTDA